MHSPTTVGPVFTRCPLTGRKIDTGIETNRAALAGAPGFVGRVYCPDCRAEHEWTGPTAWIAEPGEKTG